MAKKTSKAKAVKKKATPAEVQMSLADKLAANLERVHRRNR